MEIKILELDCDQRSPEWQEYRNRYIGSSEIGALLGIDNYASVKDLLLQKLNFFSNSSSKNSNIGILFENDILEKFKYFDFDEQVTLDNYLNKNEVRKVERINKSYILYLNNTPFIVSPDGITYDDNGNVYPVETKFMNEFSSKNIANLTSSGKYAWQSVMQQILYNSDIGYIFTLISNRGLTLDIVKREKYMPMIDEVIEKAEEFYTNLNAAREFNMPIEEILNSMYVDMPILSKVPLSNEPMISNVNREEIHKGDEEDERYALLYSQVKERENQAKKQKEVIKNYFITKYGKTKNNIVCGSYRVQLMPKFNIFINSDFNSLEDYNQ